jgi:hypothetical protein
MAQAVYTFVDQETKQVADVIEFELLDNQGVRAWQYAVMLNDSLRICTRSSVLSKFRPPNISDQYQQLKHIIDKLSASAFAWVHGVPELFDQVDQNLMNRLHRHFTNSCYEIWDHRSLNFENHELNSILTDLNKSIHELEYYIPTNTKLKFCDVTNEIFLTTPGNRLGYDLFPFRQYHSYEPADLVLDAYVLGKTLIESFYCEDDPTSWDTNGHMKTNGGSIILLDDGRSKIYNSQEFVSWLQKSNVDKHVRLADFPLGNFVAGHRNKLELLEKDLHKFSVLAHIRL